MSIQAALCGTSTQPIDGYVDPTFAYGARSGAGSITTSGMTAFPSGGVPGFTYAWAYVSGDNVFTATAPTGKSTQWTVSVTVGQDFSAYWQCTITDNVGQTKVIGNLLVSAAEISFQ